ncbi:MAG: FapA family protein [Desulfobulbaceae bacterium]|nr:FapA family protein [Desulfobulbaceae bacterium]
MADEKLFKGGVPVLDGAFMLRVVKDRLLAYLVPVAQEEGEMPDIGSYDAARIKAALVENDIKHGLLPDPEIQEDNSVDVARGESAIPGENAKVKMHVKPSMVRSPKMKEAKKDTVDFRELGAIVNVNAGQILLEKIPLTEGTPGKDVFGLTIPPKPGKDVTMKGGPGVKVSEDGFKVVASLSGKFLMADGKPAVFDSHVVKGDLDLSVGNVAFCGKSLTVAGDVLPGFKVRCKGDVIIQKNINNAEILTHGKLVVAGSIVGEDVLLRSKGDMRLGFVENGPVLETLGKLTIDDFMVQAKVKVGGDLVVVKGNGTLVGGVAVVGGSVYVKDLGSDGEVVTEINVGINPSLEVRRKKLEEEMAIWPERLNQTVKNISALETMLKTEGENMPPEKQALLAKMVSVMPKLMERVNLLSEAEKKLQEEMAKLTSECVYVCGTLYPGVTIKIGGIPRLFTMEEEAVVIHFDQKSRQIHIRKMLSEEKDKISKMES